jgi:hypothetical protein
MNIKIGILSLLMLSMFLSTSTASAVIQNPDYHNTHIIPEKDPIVAVWGEEPLVKAKLVSDQHYGVIQEETLRNVKFIVHEIGDTNQNGIAGETLYTETDSTNWHGWAQVMIPKGTFTHPGRYSIQMVYEGYGWAELNGCQTSIPLYYGVTPEN